MAHIRRPPVVGAAVTAVAFALLAAGCGGGGGGSPGVASVASGTTTTLQSGLVAYARCMRANGVPGFPDPDSSGGISKAQVVALGVSKPRMVAADRICRHLLPASGLGPSQTAQQTRAQLADELSFARCMRSHGVSRFPDPGAQGGLTVEMVQAQGIDVHSPAVLRMVQACIPASHGGLTIAKVREALRNAGR
jgi:hypothetical protein